MVTVAVIAIASAVVAPGFAKALSAGRSARAARGFVEVMRWARSEAMVRNRAVRVQFFPSATAGGTATAVASDNATCSGFSNAGLPGAVGVYTFDVANEASDVQLRTVTGSADLCVKPSGELYDRATLTVSSGSTLTIGVLKGGVLSKIRTVSILPNGNARVN